MQKGILYGVLSEGGSLSGALSASGGISGFITIPPTAEAPIYAGDYEVTPRLYSTTLETANKLMTDDVTVNEIPVVTTSNPYGGLTVVIG